MNPKKFVLDPVLQLLLPETNTYNLFGYDKAKQFLDQLAATCEAVGPKSERKTIIEFVLGQRGLAETLLFVFKFNFGQFYLVSLLNSIVHPWQLIQQHSGEVRAGRGDAHGGQAASANFALKFAAKTMADVCMDIDALPLPLGHDEKLFVLLWVAINKGFFVDYIEHLWLTTFTSQYYKSLSFFRNIFLFDLLKRLGLTLQTHP